MTRFAVVNARTGQVVNAGITYEMEENASIAALSLSVDIPGQEFTVAAVDYATV